MREARYARRSDGLRGEAAGHHRSLPELRQRPYPVSAHPRAIPGRPQGDNIPHNWVVLERRVYCDRERGGVLLSTRSFDLGKGESKWLSRRPLASLAVCVPVPTTGCCYEP